MIKLKIKKISIIGQQVKALIYLALRASSRSLVLGGSLFYLAPERWNNY